MEGPGLDVAVVVVNWNSGGCLRRLLASLLPVLGQVREARVIDNASDDGSWRDLPADPKIGLSRQSRNLGFAGAANQAIAHSEAEWILLLNPDVEADPESVRRLCGHARHSPRAAILCGPLLGSDGKPQLEFQIRPLPTPFSALRDALFLDELVGLFRTTRREVPAAPTLVEQPAAAYWLLRKAAWTELGGFDESFFPAWFEDVDFCRRLRHAGWEAVLHPDCPLRHEGGVSLRRLGRREFYRAFYGNLLRYLRKHHRAAFPWLWGPVRFGLWIRLWLAPN